jgi:hypothetical protein
VTLGSRHLSPVRRPPQDIRRSVRFSPAFQSSRGGSAPLGRHFVWPAALMGFNPSQLYSGRTVPRRLPPWRPTCRLPVPSSSMVLVEASAAKLLRTRMRPIRMCQIRLLGVHPSSQPSSASRWGRWTHAALGFASFGPSDTRWCSLAGSSPPSLTGRRLFRLRRLSALELQRRSPALPGPRWSTGPDPVSPPALQRFQRPMPCSSGFGATQRRTSFPYEVFNLPTGFRCTR